MKLGCWAGLSLAAVVLIGFGQARAEPGAETTAAPSSAATTQPAGDKAAAKAPDTLKVGSTLENLQAAYNGESNAHAKYAAFAKKADEEGYPGVASLFRAAAKSEEIHAANHAAVIRKMEGKPKAQIKAAEVKTTAENLKAAVEGESYERDHMYPAFIEKARAEGKGDAVRSFNYAKSAEAGHAKLYQAALDNLAEYRTGPRDFYVCGICGNTVTVVNFVTCPVCRQPKEKYEKVA
jgi:rubrerythrin